MTKETNFDTVLTKTKFKTGMTCPRQLYYSLNKKRYLDKNIDNPFLEALAKGGFQVSELANTYVQNDDLSIHSEKVETKNKKLALKLTNELMKKENVNIFEAAFMFDNFYVRCDIVKKRGNSIEIIEVKSKAMKSHNFQNIIDPETWIELKDLGKENDYDGVLNKVKAFGANPQFIVKKSWEEYVYDIAFQAWVVKKSIGHKYSTEFYITAPSQELYATKDALNQKFFIKESPTGYEVTHRGDIGADSLGEKILATHNVDWLVHAVHHNTIKNISDFDQFIYSLSDICLDNSRGDKNISSACKSCRFNVSAPKKINGFHQCMSEHTGHPIKEFEKRKTVYDVWNFPQASSYVLREKPIVFMDELEHVPFETIKGEMSYKERKNLQIRKNATNDMSEFLNKKELKEMMSGFKFPLHFIDFETAMTAIPYRKGQHPYQNIFFQFSHHTLEEDGTIRHAGQYINLEPYENPNIDAVRELYRQLRNDDGTIFMWSPHENTTVKKVLHEIIEIINEDADDIPDSEELIEFISSIIVGGDREMVDQWAMYKKFHFMPETNGSNSIKDVLPAILERFEPLQEFLSKPVYGRHREIVSKNFDRMSWIQKDENGKVKDPYALLPKVFKDYDLEELDLLYQDTNLKNGGAAMVAYAVCQFTQISVGERSRLKTALLRYCELDTFAMVMVYMYWEWQLGVFDSFGTEDDLEEQPSRLKIAI